MVVEAVDQLGAYLLDVVVQTSADGKRNSHTINGKPRCEVSRAVGRDAIIGAQEEARRQPGRKRSFGTAADKIAPTLTTSTYVAPLLLQGQSIRLALPKRATATRQART